MKKFGLTGAGGYARTYVRNLLERHAKKELCFCGVVIRPQDRPQVAESIRLLTEAGIPVFEDTESLYREAKPDVAAFPVAIGAHTPLALDAVAHGVHVIVEKPAAGSVAEIAQMIEAEKRTGKFIAVGFQHIYAPDIRDLKTRLVRGEFGAVRRIAAMGLWPRGDQYYRRNEWVCRLRGAHGEPVYDSPVNNAFAHYLNLALFLASREPERSAHAVEMRAELYRARRNIETFDSCGIRLKTQTEAELLMLFTHTCRDRIDPVLKIETEKGVILWSEAASWKFTSASGKDIRQGGPASDGRASMYSLLIRKAEGENVTLCPLQIAWEHTFCIEELHRRFTVSEFPETAYTINPESGIHEVSGITELFQNCFSCFLLPSEAGAVWGKISQTERIG